MKRLSITEYAFWMAVISTLADKARRRRGVTSEESEFFSAWWNSIDAGTGGEAPKLACQLRYMGVIS